MKTTRPRDLDCPACGGSNHDGKVVLFEDGNIYCHSCGETTVSKENKNKPRMEFVFTPGVYKSISPSIVNEYLKGSCNLEKFLYSKFYTSEVIKSTTLYNLGKDPYSLNGATSFIYKDIDQNFRYIKSVQYKSNGHRDKDAAMPFYAPYRGSQGFKACLFGEHLLKNHKGAVELVESEKSAIIASIKYPEKVWVASGGATGLTYDKAQHLSGRIVNKYTDCDDAGRKIDRDKKILSYFGATLVVKELDEKRNDGADIADLILEQLN